MKPCEICGNPVPWVVGDYPKRYAAKRYCSQGCRNKARRQYADERTYNRVYAQRNAERLKARKREWYINNKDKEQDRRKLWLLENPEYHRQWKKANATLVKIYGHKRRVKIKENGGSFTAKDWERKLQEHNHRCAFCGMHNDEVPLTIDHIVSIAKGGSNDISNIQPLCMSCNCKKYTS